MQPTTDLVLFLPWCAFVSASPSPCSWSGFSWVNCPAVVHSAAFLWTACLLISGWEQPHMRLLHFGGNEVGNREYGVKGKWKRRETWDWSEWGDWSERRGQITGVRPTSSQALFAAVFTVRWRNSMAIALLVGGPGTVVNGIEGSFYSSVNPVIPCTEGAVSITILGDTLLYFCNINCGKESN